MTRGCGPAILRFWINIEPTKELNVMEEMEIID